MFLLLCQSCNDIPGTHQVRVTVLDAGSWSPDNRNCSVVEEALVLLFNESDKFTKNAAPGGISDASGIALVTNRTTGVYYLEVTKDNSSNILDHEVQNESSVGFVVIGVVKTQEEAEGLPLQNGKKLVPGDVIIQDVNADGVINKYDKTPGFRIDVSGDLNITVYIADQDLFN